MNNSRRKEIKSMKGQLEFIKKIIERIRNEEEDYYDNIPENLQDSERANKSEEAIESLDEAIESLENTIDELENAME